jgi:hypothetical protein
MTKRIITALNELAALGPPWYVERGDGLRERRGRCRGELRRATFAAGSLTAQPAYSRVAVPV